MMDKAPDAYRTISEVAEDLDLPQHVLRFWETRFGQIKPLKRGGGRRYYRPDDVELLKGIQHLLYREGYTIKGVQRILKEQGVKAVQAFIRQVSSGESAPPQDQAAQSVLPDHGADDWLEVVPAVADAPAMLAAPAAENRRAAENPDEPAMLPFELPEAPDLAPSAAPVRPAGAPGPKAAEPAMARPFPSPAQVSMFRGGLQRTDGAPLPSAEFASQIRDRVDQMALRNPAAGRDALLKALEDLAAARASIDQVLARRLP